MKNTSGITNVSYVNDGDDIIAGIEKTKWKAKEADYPSGHSGDTRSNGTLSPRVLTPDEKKEKRAIMKNILIISTAFFFLFTSYNSMTNLQSSLNKVDGTTALTALYIIYIISCCLTPSWTLKVLQEKKTMALSMLSYALYMVAQFHPRIYTLVPSAMFVGVCAAPLWSAKCTYLTKVSGRYGNLTGERSDVIVNRFFGIFFLFFQATQVVGNLISSLVLSVGVDAPTETLDEESLSQCGYHFCIADSVALPVNETSGASRAGPPLWQIYTMAAIYLSCALLSSVIIFVFLDPLSRFPETENNDSNDSDTWKLLAATFNHMRHPYQLLIIPLTIWSGVEQAFLSTDFTAAYVSCGVGVHMVGYVIICYGVCDAICSLAFSSLVKKVGRVPLFTLAFAINIAIIITLTQWRPHPDDLVWFFVISGMWGVADAVWQTQINALYGVIFPGESPAAFSNYRLWESLGFAIAYICSTILCVDSKITILLVFLIPGMFGYYVIEVLEKRGSLRRDKEGKVLPIEVLLTNSS